MYDIMFDNSNEWAKKMAIFLQEEIENSHPENYQISDNFIPVIFLAGAPGAWKTEWIDSFPGVENYIVLDTDKYRTLFNGYTWTNAHEFHQYASRVMDRMYSYCIKKWYNVIMDGTFSNSQKVAENIAQCDKKCLSFSIVLVVQDPVISYLYTKKREQEKSRSVPREAFIQKFFSSIKMVRDIFEKYPNIILFITKKRKTHPKFTDLRAKDILQFDKLTNIRYTEEELDKILQELDRDFNTSFWKKYFKFN